MITILWKMPVPVTAIIQGAFFKVLPKRNCEISFSIEAADGGERWIRLLFANVEAFRCTYLTALGSIDRELRKEAYGNVIAIEGSPWAIEIRKCHAEHHAKTPSQAKELRHFMICFDDGPCYEIVCESFVQE
jgi:hypothetical protein